MIGVLLSDFKKLIKCEGFELNKTLKLYQELESFFNDDYKEFEKTINLIKNNKVPNAVSIYHAIGTITYIVLCVDDNVKKSEFIAIKNNLKANSNGFCA